MLKKALKVQLSCSEIVEEEETLCGQVIALHQEIEVLALWSSG